MRLEIRDLLARVQAAGCELEANGNRLRWRARAPLSGNLVADLRACKPGVLAALQGSIPVETYRDRICRARTWEDLFILLADAEVAFALGNVTGEQVEELCVMARQKSEIFPEQALER